MKVREVRSDILIKGIEAPIYDSGQDLYIGVDLAKLVPPESRMTNIPAELEPQPVGMYIVSSSYKPRCSQQISYIEAYLISDLVDFIYAYTEEMELARFLDKIKEIVR